MAKTTKPPSAGIKIADYISQQIEIVGKTGKSQKQIADEVGYEKPNMISMFKTGTAKVPLEKIPSLARALNVDPAFMFRLGLQQYWPDEARTIAEIFGKVLTKNRREIDDYIDEVTGGDDPELTPDLKKKLRAAFK